MAISPLVPPGRDFWSPYSSSDVNSGNPLLISLELLVKEGLLLHSELPRKHTLGASSFELAAQLKEPCLNKAATRLLTRVCSCDENYDKDLSKAFQEFQEQSSYWLPSSATFFSIATDDNHQGLHWWEWPVGLRECDSTALDDWATTHQECVARFCAIQYFFHIQLQQLKTYANSKGIKLIGDMPIYVGAHSVDVWAHQELFELDARGLPVYVSGVPPDAFSATGQLWGSPLYDWSKHAQSNYEWWCNRLTRAFELCDEVRIDHFRGFAGYWSVPGGADTAMAGSWRKGPGKQFFEAIYKSLGEVKLVAEDLGVITEDVVELREIIGAPGMVVLQFAWGPNSENPHLPCNHEVKSFVYTATHDNETTTGWFKESCSPVEKTRLLDFLGTDGSDISWDLMAVGFASVAQTCVVPMQDILSLDNSARMNTPGVAAGNWEWQMSTSTNSSSLGELSSRLHRMNCIYNRLPRSLHTE
eukprot:CAMPEP_0183790708 /NCGR_PEP_ID=MMETSP0803_2-20130417/1288_1 /TAXON_ID=195967 /ORGANISM="Crustomastix stigmata, Strain CCMP3273" /LENGTH=472 /DNA_ID=CAMNT_0026034963 /DNA_START=668 /DNA_END=2087 /DNA_ORIENTATION=-